jgi:hypothetical protein
MPMFRGVFIFLFQVRFNNLISCFKMSKRKIVYGAVIGLLGPINRKTPR